MDEFRAWRRGPRKNLETVYPWAQLCELVPAKRKRRLDSLEAAQGAPRDPRHAEEKGMTEDKMVG